jgi:hypothetical protein
MLVGQRLFTIGHCAIDQWVEVKSNSTNGHILGLLRKEVGAARGRDVHREGLFS